MQKYYGEYHLLRDVSLEAPQGRTLVICSPSAPGPRLAADPHPWHRSRDSHAAGYDTAWEDARIRQCQQTPQAVIRQPTAAHRTGPFAVPKAKYHAFYEPTSALDSGTTSEELDKIQNLAREDMTIVCVTHEMGFARVVAERVILIAEGQIIEEGTPEQMFTAAKHQITQDIKAIHR